MSTSVEYTTAEYDKLKTISLEQYFAKRHPDWLVPTRYQGRYNVYVNYDKEMHTSLEIKSNGGWSFYSKGLWGKSAFDWLCRVEHMSYRQAGSELGLEPGFTEEDFKDLYDMGAVQAGVSAAAPVRKAFQEPARYSSNVAIVKYLKSRGIAQDVIDFCIRQGYIYTEAGKYLNVVFAGYNDEGQMVYAARRGITDGGIIGIKRKITDMMSTTKLTKELPAYVENKFGIKWPEHPVPQQAGVVQDAEVKANAADCDTLIAQYPDNKSLVDFLTDVKKILILPEPFKRDATGSDKAHAFGLYNKTRKSVHFFEGAMDVLGYCSWLSENDFDFRFENLKSCGGVGGSESNAIPVSDKTGTAPLPAAIEEYLKTNQVSTIYLHFDNDEAGRAATRRVTYALKQRGYDVYDIPAPQIPGHHIKDWGDYAEVLYTNKTNVLAVAPAAKVERT